MKSFFNKYLNKDFKFDTKQKIAIIASIIIISGLFGWVYEFIFYFFNSGMKEFYYRGGNFLPWINIYAYGAFLILLLTYKKRKHPLQVFVIGALACGILELISGYLIYDVFNVQPRCWNYNEEILNFGNIGGYVCLRSVLFFGLSGLFLIYGILPMLFYVAQNINTRVFLIVSVTLCSIILIDEVYNLIFTELFNLPYASDIYKDMGIKYIYFYK